jgi:multimeric flavodoxin WrbA
MKILGISGSSRSDQKSGCHKLVETVLGASGCEVELVSLRGKKILGCTGCLGCVEDNICVLKDDMAPLREKFVEADAFVIAAPNYFNGMNAVTHALLERLYQFRHREADTLWGKLAVAIGVGGGDGQPVTDQIEGFMGYNFIETIAKVAGQGAACCFTCGYGETCKVGAVHMFFGPGTKITEDITPAVEKQPEVMQAAVDAGKELGRRLSEGHDRTAVAAKMQQQMMEKYKKST